MFKTAIKSSNGSARVFFITWVLLLLIVRSSVAQAPAQQVPDFTFFKWDKTSFTGKQLTPGKMSLFVFFDAECDHCQHAIQYLDQHHKEFKKTAIYLITLDGQEKATRFLAKYGPGLKGKTNITILQDVKNEFIAKFGPRKYPSIFLYSDKRKLVLYSDDEQTLHKFIGETQRR